MKKVSKAIAIAMAGMMLVSVPASASADETHPDTSGALRPGTSSTISPLAEAKPQEGGTWQYGRNLIKA